MVGQIEVKNVSFKYTVDNGRALAIKNINFSVGQSEFLCLLGPSGCGKTTILDILAGLLRPTDGEISIGDAPLDKNPQNRGVVFHDFAQLFPWRRLAATNPRPKETVGFINGSVGGGLPRATSRRNGQDNGFAPGLLGANGTAQHSRDYEPTP